MRTIIYILLFLVAPLGGTIYAQQATLHDFTVTTIDGEAFPLSQLKGKKVLIVNLASKCGLTPQYAELQQLYKKYGGDKFTIVGFPANNFNGQEPGSNAEIKSFCVLNYDVEFPLMAKISVKGSDISPVYEWLTQKSKNGKEDAPVQWNFQKFMIDENGKWIGMIPPKESPMCPEIINWIENKKL